MKKLKGYDIPDLVKTVKAKKLPKEALKAITGRFKMNEEKLQLVEPCDKMKEDASKIFGEYVKENETLSSKLKECTDLLQEKIKSSGLYEEAPEQKQLKSTFKH